MVDCNKVSNTASRAAVSAANKPPSTMRVNQSLTAKTGKAEQFQRGFNFMTVRSNVYRTVYLAVAEVRLSSSREYFFFPFWCEAPTEEEPAYQISVRCFVHFHSFKI